MKENELAEIILALCIENKITISILRKSVDKVIEEFDKRGIIEER